MKAVLSSFALARSEQAPSQDVCNGRVGPDSLIAVLADGVGDADYAREAADKIVESFLTYFKSRPASWSTRKALEEFTKLINRSLYQESLARLGVPEMLSTLAVVVVEGEKLYGLNVGDSRVYLLQRGELTRLSTDHNEPSPELQHVLTRAMGMEADVVPHHFEHAVAAGDVILLCSDGVTRVLADEPLQQALARGPRARSLVAAAREQATPETLDDISAVVIELQELDARAARDQSRLEIPETLQAGQVIDSYTLKQSFKNNARIWIATRRGEPFVLKFAPLAARENEAIHSQFVREMWTATRLQADYFVKAVIPEGQRMLYYVMEYHAVPTLKHFLEREPLTPAAAIELGRFLLYASQHLLRFDLVHGDMKPENILVLKCGDELSFKLIDFGSITEIFSVTSRAGTPSYLAPERFHDAPIAERTEIFAIGVTVFEALTKVYPYGEVEPFQTPEFGAAKRPCRLNSLIPPWLENVLLRALSVNAERRYQNYSEMRFDLDNPHKVKPFFQKGTSLLEKNPVLFYKVGFFALLAVNVFLLVKFVLLGHGK